MVVAAGACSAGLDSTRSIDPPEGQRTGGWRIIYEQGGGQGSWELVSGALWG